MILTPRTKLACMVGAGTLTWLALWLVLWACTRTWAFG